MIGDDALRAAVERSTARRVTALARRPSRSRTSYPLDDVDVALEDGGRLALVLKVVDRDAAGPAVRAAKPDFLYDPLRELELYRDVLERAALGTPRVYGLDVDARWLLLERVAGVELYQVGDRSTWAHVARWLRTAHAALDPAAAPRAIRFDDGYLRTWPERARVLAGPRRELDAIAEGYDAVVARLRAQPSALVHGELYASNVLVDDPVTPRRVAAVDWEQAAVAPALVDVAALTSGRWGAEDRVAIAAAYGPHDPLDLEACRLHLALQWLGWSAKWSPPPEHRQDWLAEAVRAARALGIPGVESAP